MKMKPGYTIVLWIDRWSRARGGPKTVVHVPDAWVADYRERVVGEWGGIVLAVYRAKR